MGDIKGNAFDAELAKFIVHMKHQTLEVFQPFFSFLNGFDKEKRHNMLALILDPRFKKI
jgi:hypothetical protein